jgi:hypothetical protein
MASKYIPLAIAYDFDGTLSPDYMQNYDFIPDLGMKPIDFWNEVKEIAKSQEGDEILIYMGHMLHQAGAKQVRVNRTAFAKFGSTVVLFDGVTDWFKRVNAYGKSKKVNVKHFIISSGLREMISGTSIAKYFENIYASGFWYDQHDVARAPAIAVNYTTKIQYLFRINKGFLDVWDNTKINDYIKPEDRPVPFSNMIFIGDGETDIPCFRLVKDLGDHSIAVYRPRTKGKAEKAADLVDQGRVNFSVPAKYVADGPLDNVVKRIIDKLAADSSLRRLGPAKK